MENGHEKKLKSKKESKKEADKEADDLVPQVKFSSEEEAKLLNESNNHKSDANDLFTSSKYEAALGRYDQAVAICPNYLDFEVAVLQSNIAACQVKLSEWKAAVTSATDCLNRLSKAETALKAEQEAEDAEEEAEEEIISPGAAKAAPAPAQPREETLTRRQRQESILRIRAKALLRRAKARTQLGGWGDLSGAEEDYRALSKMENIGPSDRNTVKEQLRVLPKLTEAAKEREMGEMWGKLKDLGNGLLKPFGLSTDNFQMVQDPKTGGYSMNFQGNGQK